MEKKINCPHCKTSLEIRKDNKGRIFGTVVGGGIGYGLASGLGIAGAIFGATVAIPATLVGIGVFALLGNRFGKDFDNNQLKCPKCKQNIVI